MRTGIVNRLLCRCSGWQVRRAFSKEAKKMSVYRGSAGIPPKLILFAGFGGLALAWLGVFLVDVLDLFGAGTALYEAMQDRAPSRAWFWVIMFTEGGPVEMMQWLLLAVAAGLAFHLHGRLSGHNSLNREDLRARLFWLLMGIAFLLMLIEDAGNARHWIRQAVSGILGGKAGEISEFLYYAALAAVPLSALAVFGRSILRLPGTRVFMIGGFFFYALAAGGSAMRGYWYEIAGEWLHIKVFGGALRVVEVGIEAHGFWLMDYLVEESLELIGATLLAAAAATALCRGRTPAMP